MAIFFTLLFTLSLVAVPIFLLVFFIGKLRKRPAKRSMIGFLSSLGTLVVSFILAVAFFVSSPTAVLDIQSPGNASSPGSGIASSGEATSSEAADGIASSGIASGSEASSGIASGCTASSSITSGSTASPGKATGSTASSSITANSTASASKAASSSTATTPSKSATASSAEKGPSTQSHDAVVPQTNYAEEKEANTAYVWITETGSKYHSIPKCGRTKSSTQIPLEEAMKNYDACSKCF